MLSVDLSTEKVTSKSLSKQLVERFIGGLGIGSWLTYDLNRRERDPLSEKSTIVFSVSPLAGTIAPGASRVYVLHGSPESGLVGQANAGHSMGIMMKYAGYDVLTITGRSKKPVYLKISDDDVEILDANHLWGKDTWETTDLIHNEHRDYWVDCIGPSAENLVRYSILLCNKRSSFNKAGTGAVMGSKNLKAIISLGSKGVKIANPEKFMKLTQKITERILSDPELKEWRAFGNSFRSQPGFSYGEFIDRVGKRPYSCLGCPVACKHVIELRNGVYRGLRYRFSHLSANVNHSHLAAVENWDELVKSMEVMNRYGLQTSSTSAMLKYLFECYNNGILTEKEIGFIPRLGGEALRELIQTVSLKKGIGSLGLLEISRQFEGSVQYAQHVKGVGREHNLDKTVSLSTIETLTNPRGGKPDLSQIPFGGGDVFNTNPGTYKQFYTDLGLPKESVVRVSNESGRFNLGRLVKWTEDYNVVYSSLGFCIRIIIMRHITLQELSELYTATTGIDVNSTQLLLAGERVFNVLKAFNLRAGATRMDDLPSRGLTWPSDKPLIIGDKNYGSLNQILNQYYDERGWNVETGIPTRQKLKDLGLESLADDLNS